MSSTDFADDADGFGVKDRRSGLLRQIRNGDLEFGFCLEFEICLEFGVLELIWNLAVRILEFV